MGPVDFSPNAKFFPSIKTPMLPANTFKGRVAYITGGGTGLGKDMAKTLSSLGAKVFITSRKEEVLKATASEISQQTGNQVNYFHQSYALIKIAHKYIFYLGCLLSSRCQKH
jgi:NAD(P)-dependent dehydrogenase (short-subunit alcohol dehydrogenase family)